MRNHKLFLAGLATLSLGAAACGSAQATTAPTTKPAAHAAAADVTAAQVAAKLRPLGCVVHSVASDPTPGQITPRTSWECTISGEPVSIDGYLNHDQVAHNVQLAKSVACSFGAETGITDFHFVTSGDWIVATYTTPTVNLIRNAIGGTVSAIHCG